MKRTPPSKSAPTNSASIPASPKREDGTSIDPFTEDVFPVSQTPKRLRGRRVHPSTVWRWVQRGVRGHKLQTIKIGGVTCTSENALRRFFAALSGDKKSEADPKADATRLAQVERELEKFGL